MLRIIALCLVVSGCSTIAPSTMNFPTPPALLMQPPLKLKPLPNNNELPDSASIADAAPVEVKTVAETIAGNYGICHKNSETLNSLQTWVKEQAKIK